MKSEFYIDHAKFQELDDKAVDNFIKSLNCAWGSAQWKLYRLKYEVYREAALKYLKSAIKQNG